MKKLLLLAVAVLALNVSTVRAEEKKDIVDTAVAAGSFKTLVVAVKEAMLVEALKAKGPITVFAPTDDAFKALGEDTIKAVLADKKKLTAILKAHVVEGKVMAADAAKLDGKKVNGFEVKVGKDVTIGGAKVIKADIECSNGVIHVIDKVLIPSDK